MYKKLLHFLLSEVRTVQNQVLLLAFGYILNFLAFLLLVRA